MAGEIIETNLAFNLKDQNMKNYIEQIYQEVSKAINPVILSLQSRIDDEENRSAALEKRFIKLEKKIAKLENGENK